ncbi:MAG: glycosyltransferase [Chloroflexota bacterium]
MASATIIVPCYNEEKRLEIDSFRSFRSASHTIRFLFVDDGSTDGTLRLLKSLNAADPATFQVLHFAENHGKAEAVRRGILSAIDAHPDYVGFWDADLATPLAAIDEFIDVAESRRELELIIGSRVKLLGRNIDRRATRHYLGRLFATGVSIVLGLAVYDTQCGAKLFRVSPAMRSLFERPFLSRWIFDVEILARLIQARRGMPLQLPEQAIFEIPLQAWRDIPGSKLTCYDFARAGWELWRIYYHYFRRCRRDPLRGP